MWLWLAIVMGQSAVLVRQRSCPRCGSACKGDVFETSPVGDSLYLGCTAIDAATYPLGRLASLDAGLFSYTKEDAGRQ
jgi:hypothetical protein